MTQPAFNDTLAPDQQQILRLTAEVWRSRGYGQTADNLLLVAGLTRPEPAPPSNVVRLSDYRPRAPRQVVSR